MADNQPYQRVKSLWYGMSFGAQERTQRISFRSGWRLCPADRLGASCAKECYPADMTVRLHGAN